MEAAGVLGFLGHLEQGVHVLHGDDLLALLGLAADQLDGGQGGVDVAGTDHVANVEAIDLAVSLEVIDLEGELDLCKDSLKFVNACQPYLGQFPAMMY